MWLFDQTSELKTFNDKFFYTNAISERAADWILSQSEDKPFFLYTAFYAPHFPLQAPEQAIERLRGRYLSGWDSLREKRLAKQKVLGILADNVRLSLRPKDVPSWKSLSSQQKEELDRRMATYAAQVQILDRGVGRIMDALRESGRLENTLIIFLSDNGGASSGGPWGAGPIEKVGTRDAPIKTTYGKGWATLSNTPFRMHKANTHEGGVMSPLIMHWPNGLGQERIFRRDVAHIIDIVPTVIGASGQKTTPADFSGIDLLHERRKSDAAVFYEHEKSRAIRLDNWKLVNRGKSTNWELYDLNDDRTENFDLADQQPGKLLHLKQLWSDWALRNHVKTK